MMMENEKFSIFCTRMLCPTRASAKGELVPPPFENQKKSSVLGYPKLMPERQMRKEAMLPGLYP
jgi:hypothetical protein